METVNEKPFVNLDVGVLAVIVLVVLTACSTVTLLFLYCWNRSSSHSRIHCSRCHQIIGVRGLPLPPQAVPPVQPYHLNNVHSVGYQFQSLPPNQPSPTFNAAPPLAPPNIPSIVLSQPDSVKCGDSATFQRLGMKRPDSGIADDARALETRALSSVQASPPEVTTPGLEHITPSPVLDSNQQLERRKERREQNQVPQSDTIPSKLQQVRMVNFTSCRPPHAKTPGNALKPKRSSLKGSVTVEGRTVTSMQPSQLFLAGHDRSHDQPLLDASEMCRTTITTGDLKDLCENTEEVETSLTTPYSAILHTATPSSGKTITPGSHNPSTSATQCQGNPSPLTSLNSTLTPTNHSLLAQLDQNLGHYAGKEPPIHLTVGMVKDGGVVDKRETSPNLAIIEFENNVTDRRSLAGGTAPLPATSELYITRREEEHNTSPANVFLFNKSFDPAVPHQGGDNAMHQHQLRVKKSDRRLSSFASKIPINEGYLQHNTGNCKKGNSMRSVENDSSLIEAGLDQSHINTIMNKSLNSTSGGILDKSDGKSQSLAVKKSVEKLPNTTEDPSVGNDEMLESATPVLNKSLTNSGSKHKTLPSYYPDRPKTERQPAGSTGTYTKTKAKSPNP